MIGVATALGTMGAIVGVGWLLGRHRVLGANAPAVLARTTFVVAIPALLIVTIAHADLHALVSRVALTTVLSTTAVIVIAMTVLVGLWRRDRGDATITTLASSYLNAVHLGIPIAVYVVGDAIAVVPTLLFQQLVIAPTAFALLDRAARRRARTGQVDDDAPSAAPDPSPLPAARSSGPARTFRNPIIVAASIGLLLALLPWDLPDVVFEPFRVVGAAAAPMALVAFGMSLAVPRPAGNRLLTRELALVVVLRSLVHPALAALVGHALGLPGPALLAVVTMASLPTAQNVLVFAMHYSRRQELARDAGLVTTLLTIPLMLVVAATLG